MPGTVVMFKVVAVAPPIGLPSLYHWLPLAASLVNTILDDPSHTTSGPAGVTFGVVGIGVTVTTLVPLSKVVHVVVGLVARTVMVVFAVNALVVILIAPLCLLPVNSRRCLHQTIHN
ncbi:MAG: hypothetical protein HWD62_01595 [Cyclobacteriaceae bacterium]|nr:MAG: hypothetical protein HWD62_01595 [Cyclobacteriaceae bacterium]